MFDLASSTMGKNEIKCIQFTKKGIKQFYSQERQYATYESLGIWKYTARINLEVSFFIIPQLKNQLYIYIVSTNNYEMILKWKYHLWEHWRI